MNIQSKDVATVDGCACRYRVIRSGGLAQDIVECLMKRDNDKLCPVENPVHEESSRTSNVGPHQNQNSH